MNKVKILLFATLRDYVGGKTIELDVPSGMTVGELIDLLVVSYPRLGNVKESMMAAINREYAANEQIIPEHAEVAFFPPVSGG